MTYIETNSTQWPELMRRAQNGDAGAYRHLLREISPPLKRYLKSRLFSGSHAEDVLQEILLAIHAARHTYRPEQPFSHWMYGIARHKMIDHLRKQARLNAHETGGADFVTFLADSAKNPEELLSDKDLRRAIDRLPDKQRRVLLLTKVEGLSMAEAAEKMGMSETAVKVTAHRGYRKLQEWLVADGYE